MRDLPLFRRRVGAAIREQRTALNLSQAALANRLDCTTDYVGKVERGEQNITVDTLDRFLNALICASRSAPRDPAPSPVYRSSSIGLLQVFASDFGMSHQQNAHATITHLVSKDGSGMNMRKAYDKAYDGVPEPINRSEWRIMVACRTVPRSAPELLKALNYTARTGHFKLGLRHLLQIQFLEMSLPDRPRSKHQRYCLTDKGRARLAASRK